MAYVCVMLGLDSLLADIRSNNKHSDYYGLCVLVCVCVWGVARCDEHVRHLFGVGAVAACGCDSIPAMLSWRKSQENSAELRCVRDLPDGIVGVGVYI